jgi:hypothetical protein
MFRLAAKSIASSALLLSLSACSVLGNPNPSGSNSASNTPSPTPSAIVYQTAPLTGVKYVQGANTDLTGPAVMGKIDNSVAARPQEGLNKTDMVFEELVEGGMTRFLAVWQSQVPSRFGPLRSVRPMDPDIATQFGGIICYSGGQAPFIKAMMATSVYNANPYSQMGKNTFKRVDDRVAPHNLFVKAHVLAHQHLDIAAPAQLFKYSTDAASASAATLGTAVSSVSIKFPADKAVWRWNATNSVWLRSYANTPHLDAFDQSQIHAVNVVVLKVKIDRSFKDPRYGFVPRTVLDGQGAGWVFSNGKKLAVTWKKDSITSPLKLVDSTGTDINLAAGNTWFELMPSDVGSMSTVDVKPSASPSASPTN